MHDRTMIANETLLNQLYWNSDRTIDDIIADAGVGRNSLYASIEPLSAGVSCPTCTEVLFFTNRTNRASGSATCLDCGYEMDIAGMFERAPGSDGSGAPSRLHEEVHSVSEGMMGSVSGEQIARVGGGVVLGLLVGAVGTRLARR